MAGCLEENTVLAFLGGALVPDARAAVEEHVAGCTACGELVTWAAADHSTTTTRMPGREGRPFVGDLHPGARVGRYQILGAVGRGGMGEVYAAYHPDLDRRIALKVVRSFDGRSGERRLRLLREARAIARLSHPNVVAVHDAGTFGDRVFIAMELIDGQTIDEWLRAAPRTWHQVLDVFIAAGRGLAAAHAAGVVHRDFKPQNVMIAKSGAVRVMDFGLARLAEEGACDAGDLGESSPNLPFTSVTKTGAVVGTPAYMSPEQFRREATDARSDQFSFCVALHEALFGTRPAYAIPGGADLADAPPPPSSAGGAPRWLRNVVLRGASLNRDRRYRSMEDLIAALDCGRTRLRRRVSVAAAGLAALVLCAGAWRIGHGSRFVCAAPAARLASIWAPGDGDAGNPRRQAIHRAFATSGRATAETSWQRLSQVLDEYVNAWSGTYVQTCEATHVRGEQSGDVLDLRMSCLNENLDQVRALTDALVSAEGGALSHAVTAAQALTPVSRCADVAGLRSAVSLPHDEHTLHEVQRLRRALADVQTLHDLGDDGGALKRADALRPEIEATGYKPLLGELLNWIGMAQSSVDEDPTRSLATLREAIVVAEASRDDVTAAQVAANLIFVLGYRLGRIQEAEFWAGLANAILDRIAANQDRTRSWVFTNLGAARARAGDFEGARTLLEQAAVLKERTLGPDHPDTAMGLSNLAYVQVAAGHAADALVVAKRAVEICLRHGDPESYSLALAYSNEGDALFGVGQLAEANHAYQVSLELFRKNVGPHHPELSFALHGMGMVKLALGDPSAAIPYFEDALRIRTQPQADPVLAADTQFGLARALWEAGDRTRARALASAAMKSYETTDRAEQSRAVSEWLAFHGSRKVSSRAREGQPSVSIL